jgi:hypothetical protein
MVKFKTNQSLIDAGFNQISGQTLSLSGNNIIGSTGTLRYSSDQSSTYIARSVVDAEYITGLTSGICNIGSVGEIIYRGGSGITGATGFIYDNITSGVTIPNLYISQTPVTEAGDYYFLTWDSGTTKVNKMPALSVTGIQGAVNGLSVSGDDVCLGGELISNTCIWSQSGCSISFCINNENNPIVIDNRCNGGIYLKSQCGTSSSYFDDFSNSVGFQINKCNNGFKIYDNRIGVNQMGIEYGSDYSAFYTARSLVDKSYVDAVASGLSPHAAVDVATTSSVTLSGNSQIIDGISVSDVIIGGNRILVKNQVDAKTNGIYSASTGNWGRTIDFDESSESIHGAYVFVMSGGTNKSTSWVLSTPNPISIGITSLIFTLFGQVTDIVGGTGITISKYYGQHTISVDGENLVGNSLSWNSSTCQFDVNISSGTLSTALDSKLNISTFSGYTGSTRNELNLTITGGTNGLTKSGRQLKLGGTLTGETTINGTQTLNFNVDNINLTGTTINLSGDVTLQSTPISGTTLDTILVWNSSDKKIKCVSPNIINICNVITQYTATTNNNFIPSYGQKVSVADICGNALSNPIIIDGNGKRINDISCTCSLINTNYGSITFIYNGYFWSAVAFTN